MNVQILPLNPSRRGNRNKNFLLVTCFFCYRITRSVFVTLKYVTFIFGRGSVPDPAGGAHDAPQNPLVGWGGDLRSPLFTLFNACGVLFSAPRPFCLCPWKYFCGRPCKQLSSLKASLIWHHDDHQY